MIKKSAIFALRYGSYWDTAKRFEDKSVGLAGSFPKYGLLIQNNVCFRYFSLTKKLTLNLYSFWFQFLVKCRSCGRLLWRNQSFGFLFHTFIEWFFFQKLKTCDMTFNSIVFVGFFGLFCTLFCGGPCFFFVFLNCFFSFFPFFVIGCIVL